MIQEQVLSHILLNKDSSVITLNNLTDKYFSDYTAEFKYIMEFYTKYGKIPDTETFINVFPKFDLIDVHEPTSYLMEELVRDKNKRFLAENFNKIRDYLQNDKIDDAMQLLREASEESGQAVSLQCVDLVKDTQQREDKYLDKLTNPDKYFIKTGFKELDDLIMGWNKDEDLATIVARNGLGKTWILLKCASAAAMQGKKVGIYSGEMSEDSVGYRIDTLIGHISNGALVHGGGSVKNQYKEFLKELPEKVPGSLYVLTPKMINGSAGVGALRAFIEKYDLDILFVDQHSLLVDDRHGRTPVEKAANISTDLKNLQTTKRIPIVTVCQQNREKLDDGNSAFDTRQISQSDKIAQDSSLIIFLERKDDLVKLHLVKSRESGANKVLAYRTDFNLGNFTFVPEDTATAEQVSDAGYSEDEVF
jgi:replicative DNA helicase